MGQYRREPTQGEPAPLSREDARQARHAREWPLRRDALRDFGLSQADSESLANKADLDFDRIAHECERGRMYFLRPRVLAGRLGLLYPKTSVDVDRLRRGWLRHGIDPLSADAIDRGPQLDYDPREDLPKLPPAGERTKADEDAYQQACLALRKKLDGMYAEWKAAHPEWFQGDQEGPSQPVSATLAPVPPPEPQRLFQMPLEVTEDPG